MLRTTTPAGTYRVPQTRAFLDEIRAELDDLYERLMAVDHSREAPAEHDPCFLVGWARGSVGTLLDKLEGRVESFAESSARNKKWLRQMKGR